jgi:hypothetical protein
MIIIIIIIMIINIILLTKTIEYRTVSSPTVRILSVVEWWLHLRLHFKLRHVVF